MRRCVMQAVVALALVSGLAATPARAQLFHDSGRLAARPAEVQYLYPEQVTVTAGKPSDLELHFRVAPGLHINSHRPLSEYLIPTAFSIPEGSGVRLAAAVYPPGAEVTLPLDPKTKLSVYTGEFRIHVRIVATAGDHLVQARLRYQACDNNTCMPPRTIVAAIDVIAK